MTIFDCSSLSFSRILLESTFNNVVILIKFYAVAIVEMKPSLICLVYIARNKITNKYGSENDPLLPELTSSFDCASVPFFKSARITKAMNLKPGFFITRRTYIFSLLKFYYFALIFLSLGSELH